MIDADFIALAGRDDALFRTLGLLIRQLHVKGVIAAPDLMREMHLLAAQLDMQEPLSQHSAAGMAAIAASIGDSLPAWDEARAVELLYRGQPDRDRFGP